MRNYVAIPKARNLVFACRNMIAVLDRHRNTPTLVSAASSSESDWLSSHVLTCEDNQSYSDDEAADTSVAMTSMITLLLHKRRMQTGVICRLLQSALAVGHVQILPGLRSLVDIYPFALQSDRTRIVATGAVARQADNRAGAPF